jgi:hypothetical protein
MHSVSIAFSFTLVRPHGPVICDAERLKHRCNDERFGDDRMIEATAGTVACIDPVMSCRYAGAAVPPLRCKNANAAWNVERYPAR